MTEPIPGLAYLDANVFIYFIEGEPALSEPARRLLSASSRAPGVFVTSELTLAEVLAPSKVRGPVSVHRRRDYMEVIAQNAAVEIVPVSRAILLHTAVLRDASRHKLPDAIHCATASLSNCRFLMSHDRQMQRVPAGIAWVDVNDEGVDAILGAMRA